MLEQSQPMTEEDLTRARVPRALLIVAAVIVIGFTLRYLAVSDVQGLWKQSGMQWDSEMRGDWVRQSLPSESGVEIYRIHITQTPDRVIGPESREMVRGEKLAASLHFRVATAGDYRARVLLLDQDGSVLAEAEKSPIPVAQGGFSLFRGIVIPAAVPSDFPDAGVLRLEVAALDGKALGFWETDVQSVPKNQ